ncbi:MAG: hypothetical protein A3B74_01745 [Candidatus Kerfeldbacteria bacterium RIFCSPHIGHO2_02_FULL_42_14]|uniref:CoA-binding domain-containing protein n=1 Tax=Candidatus Kerfeldbacteria bacterium RIFCSPHIGHO2_02_FULL_42_14 TaxID=1798540 RepID=A0A1G2AUT3_9BACT|nr:MAG: hypothetical protein A3B74_01745 [Candidatus Kerfeldbacteria bacterium RIFCSPHIGHO2_02_FULL_42_14]OGY82236.1 MAG: hypothetical protein A3E60_00075 [Candidatus Kerfeldbacteria bacterium RIFCSPHIGHO2_12_FULL_42_13]OGY82711.1 MAG: hypothetical protein A3I91_00965 [Candidatus Kerfeldbacteria bacterium RIFCSPLOWO2_02_FULL_42_19]
MSILIDEHTKLLIQGITGKEGQRALKAASNYHTEVLCGVTPGKGGLDVEGVPVYDTVAEAVENHPALNATAIYVPPFAAKDAVLEAIDSNIALINIMTERIPIQDTSYYLAAARERGTRIVGPSSLGMISTGKARIGVAGGDKPNEIYMKGNVGVISRSGGMTNEISWQLRKNTFGITTAIHIGGDLLMGTSYADALRLFEEDTATEGIVIFGEMGGRYEFDIVELLKQGGCTKPIAIFIGGKFGKHLPEGMTIGHAGAIIEKGSGSVEEKEKALRSVGVLVAANYEDLPKLIASKLLTNIIS